MPQATGLPQRRAYSVDRDAVLIGSVRAGDNAVAETRTGAARILSNKLNLANTFKVVATGASDTAAGGYYIEVAHVSRGAAVGSANPAAYVRLGSIVFSGKKSIELAFSGVGIEEAVRAAASPTITGDVRVVALRLVAGTGSNGLAAPVNDTGATIHYQLA